MADVPPSKSGAGPAKPKPPAAGRDARLKAALKANLARRKAQARGRAGGGDDNKTESEG